MIIVTPDQEKIGDSDESNSLIFSPNWTCFVHTHIAIYLPVSLCYRNYFRTSNRWLSAKESQLQCISNRVASLLHKAIELTSVISITTTKEFAYYHIDYANIHDILSRYATRPQRDNQAITVSILSVSGRLRLSCCML